MNNELSEKEIEIMRNASEITKGILANPNVQLSMSNDTLFFNIDGELRNIAKIYTEALIGVKIGMSEMNK